MLNYIQTNDGISMVLGGKMRTVSKDDSHYKQLIAAVKSGASEDEVAEIILAELRRLEAAAAALSEKKITNDVVVRGGEIYFRGEAVHNSLTLRMLQQLEEGFDLSPMAAFLANLMQNPSYRAVNDLYSFLEYGKMPITEDGHFLAYKAIRADWLDIHSGTFDNSIGKTVTMLRHKVNEDPNQTCSAGLHVCSFDYLPSFANANGHVVVVKVNPRDVVAIPADYHNTKMRVCEYTVLSEYDGYYTENRSCRLSRVSIATDEKPFVVTIHGLRFSTESFSVLSEASKAAEDALKLDTTESVEVRNDITDTSIWSQDNLGFEGYPDDEEEDEWDEDRDEDDEDDEDDDEDDGEGTDGVDSGSDTVLSGTGPEAVDASRTFKVVGGGTVYRRRVPFQEARDAAVALYADKDNLLTEVRVIDEDTQKVEFKQP